MRLHVTGTYNGIYVVTRQSFDNVQRGRYDVRLPDPTSVGNYHMVTIELDGPDPMERIEALEARILRAAILEGTSYERPGNYG